jgi:hypothetical protein
MDMLEERVLMIKAKDHDGAIAKAERDQKQYCKKVHTSLFNQKIISEPTPFYDSFELTNLDWQVKITKSKPVELYSRTELVLRSEKNSQIINRLFGTKPKNETLRRSIFLSNSIRSKA